MPPTPIMITTGTSATGDIITGTAVKLLINGLPAATLTAPVAGAACTGLVAASSAAKCIVNGLPVANITAGINGVNPATGVPIATTAINSSATSFIV